MQRRGRRQRLWVSAGVAAVWLLAAAAASAQEGARFVGESKCGNPTCHGAGLPRTDAERQAWRPWKSARTQWFKSSIDHHSRAYATLETAESKAIAGYMGIAATASDKCLRCHAPQAETAPGASHQRKDGVSCEHCHGPAEQWLKPHVEKDWKEKKAQYAGRGFYDNGDFRKRAEKCASCHVEIDHEIVAGGHPPLQFEMVAYAQIMKHWDDQVGPPPASFSVDPTLWSVGQLTGLRHAAAMIARRAANENYQSIGKFSHFEEKECYQCHHKLVDDALRQAQGHYAMADVVLASVSPGEQGQLTSQWNELVSAVASGAQPVQQAATRLEQWLGDAADRVQQHGVDRDAAKKMLGRITASGDRFKAIKRFSYSQPATSNVTRVDAIGSPWWYTTGAPEQTIFAIESLCGPVYGAAKCGKSGIEDDLRRLVGAVNRFEYRGDQFVQALAAINKKLGQ